MFSSFARSLYSVASIFWFRFIIKKLVRKNCSNFDCQCSNIIYFSVDSLGSKVFCWELILIFVGLRFLQGGDSLSSGVLSNLSHFLLSHIERFVTRETQCELFAHFHSLSLRWHLSRKTGEVLRILDNGPYSINTILQFFVFTLAPAVLDIIIAMLYFSATIDRYFALLFLISTIIYLGKQKCYFFLRIMVTLKLSNVT